MNTFSRLLTASAALVIATTSFTSTYGQVQQVKTSAEAEQEEVNRANAELDQVYKQLMGKLEAEQQKSLKEAQRAWIKWRDAEAGIMARLTGAIGGSAMREAYANAQIKLIKERTEVLKGYLKDAANSQ